MKEKILYAITTEDLMTVSDANKVLFTEEDLHFIEDKIGDFLGSYWYGAVEYALEELKRKDSHYGANKRTQKSRYRNDKNLPEI